MYIAQGLRHRPAHRRAAGQLWEKGGGAWDASCTMENPEARICCGPHDCGPLRIYDGTAEEISTGGWQVTIPPGTHPLVPGGATRVFRAGGRGTYPSQRLAAHAGASRGALRWNGRAQ